MKRKRKSSTTQEPPADISTAVAEPRAVAPETATTESQPGFAERLGQRTGTAVPDPFGIAG